MSKIRTLNAALLFAALLGPFAHIPKASISRYEPKPKHWLRRSGYKPHQSARECARRIGGETWANFRANDRKRRGLEA